jgi:hypothetical protein
MLNLGQVVYDLTNERILIFGGVEMIQDQGTGECHTNTSFLTEESEALYFGKDEKVPFKYTNFPPENGIVPLGEFVAAAELYGHYFGCLFWGKILEDSGLVESVKNTFKAAKDLPIPENK